MPKVRFKGYGEVDAPVGTTILAASIRLGAPEGSACGGVCACSTCHVYVTDGAALLTEMSDEENDILDKAFDVRANSRLGCQAKLRADGAVEVDISRESLEAFLHEHPTERARVEAMRK